MWSFWSRNPTKDFGCDILDLCNGFEEKSIWFLHKGKKKSTGEEVSIFRFECKQSNEDQFEKTKAAVKRLKTLRHPSFLPYIDSVETEKLVCVVTEAVEPLNVYLEKIKECPNDEQQFSISWGIHQVAVGLGFLINECNLRHNNIFMGSIFVNKAGCWKIGGLEYVTSATEDAYPYKHISALEIYSPPERSDLSTRKVGPKWAEDSYGLGVLIWEVFNGSLTQKSALRSVGKLPKSLVPQYKQLINNIPDKRISPMDFVQACRGPNRFLKNNFIDAMLFLEEIQIKEQTEKNRFLNHLNDQINSFPKDICKNKILPQLVTAFEFSNAGSAILGPLFTIGKMLDEDEYQKKIVPCIIKLFACKDRATRAKLLQQIESFINYLQPNVVNEMVYPHVAQGFLDSNPTIREQTVKCMLHLAPKLNYNNLNEDMLKHFARLQSRDEEGGIRTNTTVCMGKIACHLHPQTRQTVLIPSFLRSMRDPFAPARIAGILALAATQNFYSLKDTATKIMPALCHLTMDNEKSVRDQAFKALKGFINKVEKVSEDPSLSEQMEADVNTSGNVSSTAISLFSIS
ncbi:N-terminal kinase-like protein [Dinothrombium tinctorium]|uniref:N-terminal kinase-like protein n=1 Tax=Dinothrombium tinctorium TaxID=1965070 RepID=A0A3S3PY37_9ACAR|nr:N-terminal kinase-like protein [Dinothrombium tinctorium]